MPDLRNRNPALAEASANVSIVQTLSDAVQATVQRLAAEFPLGGAPTAEIEACRHTFATFCEAIWQRELTDPPVGGRHFANTAACLRILEELFIQYYEMRNAMQFSDPQEAVVRGLNGPPPGSVTLIDCQGARGAVTTAAVQKAMAQAIAQRLQETNQDSTALVADHPGEFWLSMRCERETPEPRFGEQLSRLCMNYRNVIVVASHRADARLLSLNAAERSAVLRRLCVLTSEARRAAGSRLFLFVPAEIVMPQLYPQISDESPIARIHVRAPDSPDATGNVHNVSAAVFAEDISRPCRVFREGRTYANPPHFETTDPLS